MLTQAVGVINFGRNLKNIGAGKDQKRVDQRKDDARLSGNNEISMLVGQCMTVLGRLMEKNS